jgi:pilus assembly protein CpaB
MIAAVGTAALARKFIQSPQATARSGSEAAVVDQSTQILVAARSMPAGTLVKDGDLKYQPWPKDGIAEDFVVKVDGAEKAYVGAVVRRGIAKGEPVTDKRLVKPGEQGFLAAIVEPGYRAVSVPINATTGVAGLFFPGDRVDVIMTHVLEQGDFKRFVSETILNDVRVIAVDQKVEDIDGEPVAKVKTATLEVSPKGAEVLAMAGTLGKLSLSLISVTPEGADEAALDLEEGSVRADSFTVDSDVSAVIDGPKVADRESKVEVEVIRGGKSQVEQFGALNGGVPVAIMPFGAAQPGTPADAASGVSQAVGATKQSSVSGLNGLGNAAGNLVEGE